jgi:hypothetical protein
VFDAYGVRNAVVVGPNSGYDEGYNECLLEVVARSEGRFKGLAVVSNDVGRAELKQYKAANIIGIAFNVALLGVESYQNTADLLTELRDLDDAFGLDGCVWGSDRPFLRASERIDYGPLLRVVEVLLPDPANRRKVLWDTRPDGCSRSTPEEGLELVVSYIHAARAAYRWAGHAL